MKRLKEFNLALLCKWKWRIIVQPYSVGDIKMSVIYGGGGVKGEPQKSQWWRDILALEGIKPLTFFKSNCSVDVGNGILSYFWHSNWTCWGFIKDLFPLSYSFSLLQDVSVSLMGSWNQGVWGWGDFGIPLSVLNSTNPLPAAATDVLHPQ